MKYLLYCIFQDPEGPGSSPLSGVDGQPVFLAGHKGLKAAISRVFEPRSSPTIPQVMAYERVIETFHRKSAQSGVIPMRYGSLFDEEAQILRFLKEHEEEYISLLQTVRGCEEMGIRILLPPLPLPLRPGPSHSTPQKGEPKSDPSGKSYLAARKAHYEKENENTREMNLLIERYRCAFSGLSLKSTTEQRTIREPKTEEPRTLLSLFFLVPRHSLQSFRAKFQEIRATDSTKLLLSGPWPPYTFVWPETPSAQVSEREKINETLIRIF